MIPALTRNNLLLLLISAYLILNYGFMQLRFPPGGVGVPVGEIILIFVLITIHYPSTLPNLSSIFPVKILFFWWVYIFIRSFSNVPSYGLWAIRDATNVVESLFILAGFAFAMRPKNLIFFFKCLRRVIFIGTFYGLTYPFAEYLKNLSPKLISGSGQPVPLFFTYTNSFLMLILGASYLLLFKLKKGINEKPIYLLAVSILTFTIMLFQARTIYLQIIAVIIIFFIYRKNLIGESIAGIILCIGFVAILPFIGLSIQGRLGQVVSLDFLFNHILAIGGIENVGVKGSAKGVSLRLDWWLVLYQKLTSDITSFFFGLGYGFPLIDYKITGGISVREPHNSYISFFSRSGLIGFSFFIWVHVLLLRVWHRTYSSCRRLKWKEGENQLLIMLIFFVLVWVFAIGEDAFEKPFNTIPYYFFWGIVLRFAFHLKHKNIGPKSK